MKNTALLKPKERRYGPRPWLYRPVAWILNLGFRLRYHVTVLGTKHLPTESGYIYAMKHASMLDIFALGLTRQQPMGWLAKATLFRWWPMAIFLHGLGAVPVIREKDRKDRRNYRRGLDKKVALEALAQSLEREVPVVVFAEGQRSDPRLVEQVKSGATELALAYRCSMVPTGIAGSKGEVRRGRFCRQQVVLVFGPAIMVTQYPGEDAVRTAQATLDLRTALQNCTDHAWSVLERF